MYFTDGGISLFPHSWDDVRGASMDFHLNKARSVQSVSVNSMQVLAVYPVTKLADGSPPVPVQLSGAFPARSRIQVS